MLSEWGRQILHQTDLPEYLDSKLTEDEKETPNELILRSGNEGPKNPKGSARAKFNRRRKWLAHALDQMDIAIDDLLSQEGTVYKRQEIDTLKAAISDFRDTTGIESEVLEPPTQEELDHFMEVLSSAKPWEPAPKEDLVELYATLGLHCDDDDGEEFGREENS